MDKDNSDDKAYLDVTITRGDMCYVDICDNGELSKYLAIAMVQDDNLLGILAEAYILYQEKIGQDTNIKTKNKIVN